jgi:VRR-NUC domain-containing protein
MRTGQRDLFTKRVRKPPAAKEIAIHCMVADVLRRWLSPGWRFNHIASGEYRLPATAARLKKMGVQPGWADLILINSAGQAFFLELKRRGGHLSEAQEQFAQWCGEHSIPFAWADSLDEALAVLRRWGALRVEIAA